MPPTDAAGAATGYGMLEAVRIRRRDQMPEIEEVFVTPPKACAMTGICHRTLRRWIASGKCPGRRGPTGRYSVPMSWVRQHLAERNDGGIAPAE